MTQKTVRIQNESGLHARAAAKLVRLCEKFKSDVKLFRGRMTANAKSIMGVMMLAAERGMSLRIVVRGPDAAKALAEIVRLIDDKFGEGK